jgi:hypothetical protein
MKQALLLIALLVAVQALAQEKSTITVKSAETSNGVVIVTAQKAPFAAGEQLTQPGKKTVELQCNKDMSGCTPLKAGNYLMVKLMVKLPPNRGMYDCANAQVFAIDADPGKADRIGEYCLTEK